MTSSVWVISNDPPTVTEVQKTVDRLQSKRAAGADDLPPALFKNGNSNYINLLTNLFEHIWRSEAVPLNWRECTVIPIFKKERKSSVTTTEVLV